MKWGEFCIKQDEKCVNPMVLTHFSPTSYFSLLISYLLSIIYYLFSLSTP